MKSYDVVLSYASEQRAYVEQVAKNLQNKGLKVFYDCYQEIDLWGKNLDKELWEIFCSDADCFVIFVSKEYIEKEYPHFECSALIKRIMENGNGSETDPLILPVTMDNSTIPLGIKQKKYVEAVHHTPAEMAEMIIKKLEIEGRTLSLDQLFEQLKFIVKKTCKHNIRTIVDTPQLFSVQILSGFYFSFKKCSVSGTADCIYLYDFNPVGAFCPNLHTAVISLDNDNNIFRISNTGYYYEAMLYKTIRMSDLKQMMIMKLNAFLK